MPDETPADPLSEPPPESDADLLGQEPSKSASRIRTVTQSGIVGVQGTFDDRIAVIAAAQEGRVARWQLLAAGVSPDAIRSRLARRTLVREQPGVYALGHAAPTRRSREVVALLASRTYTLIAGANAAAMWALPVTASDSVVEVLVPARFGDRVRHGLIVHRTKDPEHFTPRFVDRIPVTSPAWTLLDVAGGLSPRQLERAVDEALAIRIVTLDELERVLARCPNRRGVGTLARLVSDRVAGEPGARTQPGGEQELQKLLRAAGVTGYVTDVRLGGWQIDVWFAKIRLVIEVDGYRWHSRRSAWERDRRKDTYLRDHHIDLLRFTWEEIRKEPMMVVARIVRRIAELEAAAVATAGRTAA